MRDARFTSRQVTTMVATVGLAAAVLAPVGAQAVTTVFTTITEGPRTAHVNTKGGLTTTAIDPITGKQARVDATGRLVVGDGGGPLTVDGSTRPLAPALPWSGRAILPNDTTHGLLAGPVATTINLTSLTVTAFPSSGTVPSRSEFILVTQVVGPAAPCPATPPSGSIVFDAGVSTDAPLVQTFPTALQLRPPAGQRGCLYGFALHAAPTGVVVASASGFFGS